MLSAGIVGLPNVGKSTLFNAVTRTRKAQAANYPFCTIDPNLGVVIVPDSRLEVLAKLSHSQKIIPAAIEFVDIAGLVKGASQGEGLGNKFLTHVREVDAIIQVARDSAVERQLSASPPQGVGDGEVIVDVGYTTPDGHLDAPPAGAVVLSVPSPEALAREADEVRRVIAHAGPGVEPLRAVGRQWAERR